MSGKHVLITGASSGIGRALALRYAQDGARLSLFGRDAARLEASAKACRDKGADVASFVVDVQNRAGMAKAVSEALALAPLDIVVANAGVATGLSPGQILENPDAVRATLAINVIGVLNTVEPAMEAMTQARLGHDRDGRLDGRRARPAVSPAYCASKAAVYSYAEALRGVLAPHGVDVCMIVPGYVATPMAAAHEKLAARQHLRRGGGGHHRERAGAPQAGDRLPVVHVGRVALHHFPAAALGRRRDAALFRRRAEHDRERGGLMWVGDGLRDALLWAERGLLGHFRRDDGRVDAGDHRAALDRGASRDGTANSRRSRSSCRSRCWKTISIGRRNSIFAQNYPQLRRARLGRRPGRRGGAIDARCFRASSGGADAVFALDREIREKPQGGQSRRALHASDLRHDPDEGRERHSGARRSRRAYAAIERGCRPRLRHSLRRQFGKSRRPRRGVDH